MAYAYVGAGQGNATVTYTVTPGNLIVWMSRTSAGGGDPQVLTCETNTAVALSSAIATYVSSINEWYTFRYLANVGSGVTSVTATYNGGNPGTLNTVLLEFSGIATASAFITSVKQTQATPGITTDAITSGTTSVTVSGGALVMGVTFNQGGGDTVGGTGYTTELDNDDLTVYHKRITTTASHAATATAGIRGLTDTYETVMLAFNEPGGDTLMAQICL
jgi:hypothetical protein